MRETVQQPDEHCFARSRIYVCAFRACWVLIVVWAAWRRYSLPAEPLLDRDFWGYLGPALEKIAGAPFVQSENRAFVYPGFIYMIISVFRSLGAITVVQHLLGLATGLLLLGNWIATRRLLLRPFISVVLHDVAGLALLAIYLVGAQPIPSEHYLRPESISPFFAMLEFGCIIRFLIAKHIDCRPRLALYYGAAALAASFLLPLLKPSYSFTAILTTLPVWWHLFDRRVKWIGRLTMIGVPVLAAVVLLWLPEARYSAANSRSVSFLPASLFTIHASQIRIQIASDLNNNSAEVPYSHEQLEAILQLLDTEIELSRPRVRHTFSSLGFHPDYLLYDNSFCRKLNTILPDPAAQTDFYRYYFRRTWLQQPGAMLQKFTTQLRLFYGLDCPVYEPSTTNFAHVYKDSIQSLANPVRCQPLISRVPAAARYTASLPALAEVDAGAEQPKVLEVLMSVFAHTYLAGLLLAIGTIIWLRCDIGMRAACGHFAMVVVLGYAYNFGNSIGIALLHTLGVGRYSHVQMATTLLTQVLSLWLVIETFSLKFRHGAESPEPL